LEEKLEYQEKGIDEWRDIALRNQAQAIRDSAERVAEALQKENFPTLQALAMGRFYSDLLADANKLEKGDEALRN